MSTDPESCTLGWKYFDGSCYKVVPGSITDYSTAQSSCHDQPVEADLVKIPLEGERNFLKDQVSGAEMWIGIGPNYCTIMDRSGGIQNIPINDGGCSATRREGICEQGK